MSSEVRKAKFDHKQLKKNTQAYNTSLNEVLTAFSKAEVPS